MPSQFQKRWDNTMNLHPQPKWEIADHVTNILSIYCLRCTGSKVIESQKTHDHLSLCVNVWCGCMHLFDLQSRWRGRCCLSRPVSARAPSLWSCFCLMSAVCLQVLLGCDQIKLPTRRGDASAVSAASLWCFVLVFCFVNGYLFFTILIVFISNIMQYA